MTGVNDKKRGREGESGYIWVDLHIDPCGVVMLGYYAKVEDIRNIICARTGKFALREVLDDLFESVEDDRVEMGIPIRERCEEDDTFKTCDPWIEVNNEDKCKARLDIQMNHKCYYVGAFHSY